MALPTDPADLAALAELHARIADVEHGLHYLQVFLSLSIQSTPLTLPPQLQHDALASQSASLVANIAAKRVPNAPIRALIPEICHIIFAYCAEPECALDCNIQSHSVLQKPPPVVLASVCRRWRALVLHNPCLWSTLHLRPTMHSPSEINRARLYLSRSADIPLRVTICPANLPSTEWDIRLSIAISPLIYLLKPEFHRIQSFKTHLGMELLPLMFPVGRIIHMPLLEELSLLMDDHRITVTAFGRLCSPNLRILQVRDITPFLEVFDGILPTIHTLSVTESLSWKFSRIFPGMLARCVSLRSCTINFPNSLFFLDLEPIELPELQYLQLEWPLLFEPSPIFRALRTPELRTLKLVHLSRQLLVQPRTLLSLQNLLSSATKLQSLSVSGCNILSENDSILLLQESQSIENLEIDHCLRGDRFLLPLTPTHPQDADKAWLCPSLTHVTLRGIRDWDVRPVINFAKSRSNGKNSTSLLNNRKFLTDIVLDTNSEHLSRKARLLLFSGMLGVQNFLNIAGPFGGLFGSKP